MELDYSNFDEESRELINELTKKSDKFSKLIVKLQNSKISMNSKSKSEVSLKEELKK